MKTIIKTILKFLLSINYTFNSNLNKLMSLVNPSAIVWISMEYDELGRFFVYTYANNELLSVLFRIYLLCPYEQRRFY